MRNLFWILLLANVILFAVIQRSWLYWGEQEIQAQPDLNSDMIRLLPERRSSPAKPSSPAHAPVRPPTPTAPAPVSAPAPAVAPPAPVPAPSPSPAMNMAASDETAPNKLICLEWGDFSGSDLTRAKSALSTLQLADKVSQRQIERDIGYWVYIPPLKNKAAVNRKIGELKALGIEEYFVVQGSSGHWLNAISLGVFKTRDAAQNFLHALNAKGVRTARVGERASKLKTTVFMLNEVDAATQTKLKEMQKDFPGSELNYVSCGLTR
jgi:hypothetical protein